MVSQDKHYLSNHVNAFIIDGLDHMFIEVISYRPGIKRRGQGSTIVPGERWALPGADQVDSARP